MRHVCEERTPVHDTETHAVVIDLVQKFLFLLVPPFETRLYTVFNSLADLYYRSIIVPVGRVLLCGLVAVPSPFFYPQFIFSVRAMVAWSPAPLRASSLRDNITEL